MEDDKDDDILQRDGGMVHFGDTVELSLEQSGSGASAAFFMAIILGNINAARMESKDFNNGVYRELGHQRSLWTIVPSYHSSVSHIEHTEAIFSKRASSASEANESHETSHHHRINPALSAPWYSLDDTVDDSLSAISQFAPLQDWIDDEDAERPLYYGGVFQLRNNVTQSFLAVRNSLGYVYDAPSSELPLYLTHEESADTEWQFSPASKCRMKGEHVRGQDVVEILHNISRSKVSKLRKLSAESESDNFVTLVSSLQNASIFKLRLYSKHVGKHTLALSDLVTITHKDEEASLTLQGQHGYRTLSHLSAVDLSSNTQYATNLMSAAAWWEMESLDSTSRGAIHWNEPIRLRHALTGQYLCVADTLKQYNKTFEKKSSFRRLDIRSRTSLPASRIATPPCSASFVLTIVSATMSSFDESKDITRFLQHMQQTYFEERLLISWKRLCSFEDLNSFASGVTYPGVLTIEVKYLVNNVEMISKRSQYESYFLPSFQSLLDTGNFRLIRAVLHVIPEDLSPTEEVPGPDNEFSANSNPHTVGEYEIVDVTQELRELCDKSTGVIKLYYWKQRFTQLGFPCARSITVDYAIGESMFCTTERNSHMLHVPDITDLLTIESTAIGNSKDNIVVAQDIQLQTAPDSSESEPAVWKKFCDMTTFLFVPTADERGRVKVNDIVRIQHAQTGRILRLGADQKKLSISTAESDSLQDIWSLETVSAFPTVDGLKSDILELFDMRSFFEILEDLLLSNDITQKDSHEVLCDRLNELIELIAVPDGASVDLLERIEARKGVVFMTGLIETLLHATSTTQEAVRYIEATAAKSVFAGGKLSAGMRGPDSPNTSFEEHPFSTGPSSALLPRIGGESLRPQRHLKLPEKLSRNVSMVSILKSIKSKTTVSKRDILKKILSRLYKFFCLFVQDSPRNAKILSSYISVFEEGAVRCSEALELLLVLYLGNPLLVASVSSEKISDWIDRSWVSDRLLNSHYLSLINSLCDFYTRESTRRYWDQRYGGDYSKAVLRRSQNLLKRILLEENAKYLHYYICEDNVLKLTYSIESFEIAHMPLLRNCGEVESEHGLILAIYTGLCLEFNAENQSLISQYMPIECILKVLDAPRFADKLKRLLISLIRHCFVLVESHQVFLLERTMTWDMKSVPEIMHTSQNRGVEIDLLMVWLMANLRTSLLHWNPTSKGSMRMLASVLETLLALLNYEILDLENEGKQLIALLLALLDVEQPKVYSKAPKRSHQLSQRQYVQKYRAASLHSGSSNQSLTVVYEYVVTLALKILMCFEKRFLSERMSCFFQQFCRGKLQCSLPDGEFLDELKSHSMNRYQTSLSKKLVEFLDKAESPELEMISLQFLLLLSRSLVSTILEVRDVLLLVGPSAMEVNSKLHSLDVHLSNYLGSEPAQIDCTALNELLEQLEVLLVKRNSYQVSLIRTGLRSLVFATTVSQIAQRLAHSKGIGLLLFRLVELCPGIKCTSTVERILSCMALYLKNNLMETTATTRLTQQLRGKLTNKPSALDNGRLTVLLVLLFSDSKLVRSAGLGASDIERIIFLLSTTSDIEVLIMLIYLLRAIVYSSVEEQNSELIGIMLEKLFESDADLLIPLVPAPSTKVLDSLPAEQQWGKSNFLTASPLDCLIDPGTPNLLHSTYVLLLSESAAVRNIYDLETYRVILPLEKAVGILLDPTSSLLVLDVTWRYVINVFMRPGPSVFTIEERSCLHKLVFAVTNVFTLAARVVEKSKKSFSKDDGSFLHLHERISERNVPELMRITLQAMICLDKLLLSLSEAYYEEMMETAVLSKSVESTWFDDILFDYRGSLIDCLVHLNIFIDHNSLLTEGVSSFLPILKQSFRECSAVLTIPPNLLHEGKESGVLSSIVSFQPRMSHVLGAVENPNGRVNSFSSFSSKSSSMDQSVAQHVRSSESGTRLIKHASSVGNSVGLETLSSLRVSRKSSVLAMSDPRRIERYQSLEQSVNASSSSRQLFLENDELYHAVFFGLTPSIASSKSFSHVNRASRENTLNEKIQMEWMDFIENADGTFEQSWRDDIAQFKELLLHSTSLQAKRKIIQQGCANDANHVLLILDIIQLLIRNYNGGVVDDIVAMTSFTGGSRHMSMANLAAGASAEESDIERWLSRVSSSRSPLAPNQVLLDLLGATTVSMQLASFSNDAVISHSYRTLALLLDGGNKHCQGHVIRKLTTGESFGFSVMFDLDAAILRATEWARANPWWICGPMKSSRDIVSRPAITMEEQIFDSEEMDETSEGIDFSWQSIFRTFAGSLKAADGADHELMLVRIPTMLSFIKQLAEGHNRHAQAMMRGQQKTSYDIVLALIGLLDALLPPLSMVRISARNDHTWWTMICQLLETLIELVQGPAVQNQQIIASAISLDILLNFLAVESVLQVLSKEKLPVSELESILTDTMLEQTAMINTIKLLSTLFEGRLILEYTRKLNLLKFGEHVEVELRALIMVIDRVTSTTLKSALMDNAVQLYIFLSYLYYSKDVGYLTFRCKDFPPKYLRALQSRLASCEFLQNGYPTLIIFDKHPLSSILLPEDRELFLESIYHMPRADRIESFHGKGESIYSVVKMRREVVRYPIAALCFSWKVVRSVRLFSNVLAIAINIFLVVWSILNKDNDSIYSILRDRDPDQHAAFLVLELMVFLVAIVFTGSVLFMCVRYFAIEAPLNVLRQRPTRWHHRTQPMELRSAASRWGRNVVKFVNVFGLYLLLSLAAAVLGLLSIPFSTPYWFAFHLIDIPLQFRVLTDVMRAVAKNVTSLLATLCLIALIVYFYAVVGFLWFSKVLIRDTEDQDFNLEEGSLCRSIMHCFLMMVGQIPSNGDYLRRQILYFEDDAHLFWGLVFAVTFFLVVVLVLFNIFFGIILDTFSQMRQEKNAIRQGNRSRCFICGLDSNVYDREGRGFENHVNFEHNMWDFLHLYIYLVEKRLKGAMVDFTGAESYLYHRMTQTDVPDVSFYPVGQSLILNARREGK